jgi:hypothetical protein
LTARDQAELLRILCSNLTTDGVTVLPTYEKPPDILAERPLVGEWLPRQGIARTARAFVKALAAA